MAQSSSYGGALTLGRVPPSPARQHKESAGRRRKARKWFVAGVAASAAVFPFLAPEGMPLEHYVLGLALWALCWYPSARYFARGERTLPAFELICIAYGAQFALPAFIARPFLRIAMGDVSISPGDKTAVLILSLLGVGSMQLGYYVMRRGRYRRLLPTVRLPLDPRRGLIYAVVMGLAGMVILYSPLLGLLSWSELGGSQALAGLIANQVNVAIAILVWLVYAERYNRLLILFVYGLVAAAVLAGLSQGGMEAALIPVAAFVAARWLYLRKVPWLLCALCLICVLALQPVKGKYRTLIWSANSGGQTSLLDNAGLWAGLAADYWGEVIKGEEAGLGEGVQATFQRVDFIHVFAHVWAMTPDAVPYQYGGTYSYLLVTLIPRAVWSDKPIAQEANDFFGLSYGISTSEQIGQTMTGVSLLIESFINFGVPGVVLIMFLQGVIFSTLNNSLNTPEAGAGSWAIYISITIYFLNGIGSNTAALFGGLIQIVIVNYLLMSWARKSRRARAA